MNLNDLKKPFPASKISWRVGSVSKDKKKAMALAYLDARDVMERLDAVCGLGGWQATHPHANGKTSCRIGIKVGDEWVWKENGAGDSQVEAEKGAFSDSFKRAAVLWGIGRYLYDVPNIWVEIDEYKQIKNLNDPRLANALAAAEKGIKLEDEPEQTGVAETKGNSPFPTNESCLEWMKYAKDNIERLKTAEDVSEWVSVFWESHVAFLGPKQQEAINGLLNSQREKFIPATLNGSQPINYLEA